MGAMPEQRKLLLDVLPLFKSNLLSSKDKALQRAHARQSAIGSSVDIPLEQEKLADFFDDFCIEVGLLSLKLESFDLSFIDARACGNILASLTSEFESILSDSLLHDGLRQPAANSRDTILPKLHSLRTRVVRARVKRQTLSDLDQRYKGLVTFPIVEKDYRKLLKVIEKCTSRLDDLLKRTPLQPRPTKDNQIPSGYSRHINQTHGNRVIHRGQLFGLLHETLLRLWQKFEKTDHPRAGIENAHAMIDLSSTVAEDNTSFELSSRNSTALSRDYRVVLSGIYKGEKQIIYCRVEVQDVPPPSILGPTSKVRFTSDSPEQQHEPRFSKISCLCEIILEGLKAPLHSVGLLVHGGQVYFTGISGSPCEWGHPVALRALLHEGSLLKCRHKMQLTYNLVYSLLNAQTAPFWQHDQPQTDDIYYLTTSSILELPEDSDDLKKPFFVFEFTTCSSPMHTVAAENNIHSHPFLMNLGVLLLEVQYGTPVEWMEANLAFTLEDNIANPNTKYVQAWRVIESWATGEEMPGGVRRAIEACLRINFLPVELMAKDTAFHKALYEHIVGPLEDETRAIWAAGCISDSDEMERPENEGVTTTGNTESPKLDALHQVSDTTQPNIDVQMSRVPDTITIPVIPSQKLLLFDDQTDVGTNSSARSDTWFEYMDNFLNIHINPLFNYDNKDAYDTKETKIAILDTGIDLRDPDIRAALDDGRIKERRNFVADENGVVHTKDISDAMGHGTHTAGLLLKVAPGAHICVARIAKDKFLDNEDYVADAIHWALECGADIITMSFGFKKRSDKIHDALLQAYGRNKIMFAATSNGGANVSVAYPACHSTVIGINSSDGLGNKSAFNPSPVKDKMNFCTLGESVLSSWPVALGGDGQERKSGTSFATPIAAGMAACLLDYVRLKVGMGGKYTKRLYSSDGIRAVFKLMAEEKDPGFYYIAPWKFWDEDIDEDFVRSTILEKLRTVT